MENAVKRTANSIYIFVPVLGSCEPLLPSMQQQYNTLIVVVVVAAAGGEGGVVVRCVCRVSQAITAAGQQHEYTYNAYLRRKFDQRSHGYPYSNQSTSPEPFQTLALGLKSNLRPSQQRSHPPKPATRCRPDRGLSRPLSYYI